MYLNTKCIDVFKYFLNTFVNTFFILFSKYRLYSFNPLAINLKINEILDIKLVLLYSMLINITDNHVIYYITCLYYASYKLAAYRIS